MFLIEIEGHDYSGKSTLVDALKDQLDDIIADSKTVALPFNKQLIHLGEYDLPAKTTIPVFSEDRYFLEHITDADRPKFVLADRYLASTYVYQAKMEPTLVEMTTREHVGRKCVNPDMLILCSCTAEEVQNRMSVRRPSNFYDQLDRVLYYKAVYEQFVKKIGNLDPYRQTKVIVVETDKGYDIKGIVEEIMRLQCK